MTRERTRKDSLKMGMGGMSKRGGFIDLLFPAKPKLTPGLLPYQQEQELMALAFETITAQLRGLSFQLLVISIQLLAILLVLVLMFSSLAR